MKEWIICLPDGKFSENVYPGFKIYLSNNWGIRGYSPLARSIYADGVLEINDIIAIVLNSYQRKLKGEEIGLQEQLNLYRYGWKDNWIPFDSLSLNINGDTIGC